MATYTVAANKRSTDALTLTANVTDTVTVAGGADRRPRVVVHPSSPASTTPVWVTFDGNDPDPAQGFASPLWPGQDGAPEGVGSASWMGADITIKLKSTAAQVYSVES